ncbi:MAG TPA: NuoF family protein [Dehalococcoidales bacterium]|nr:NuoF family protein [Dehalococcoidales bacterium]
MAKINSAGELETLRKSILAKRDPNKTVIAVCNGTGCQAYGSKNVVATFQEQVKSQGLDDKVEVKPIGCPGFCERGTLVIVKPQDVFYQRVRPKDVAEVVTALGKKDVVSRLLFADKATGAKVTRENDVPFYKKQQRLIIGNNGLIDPTKIEDYLAIGGYSALAKALKMSPDTIIDEIKKSGLRGRGGAGFPTGNKWETTRHAHGDVKYVIANGDEGDPGAFMDRALIEGNPHSVLEGMIIGAFAIGAHQGYMYIRNEYPLAVKNMGIALQAAEELGLLGKNILGSGFDLTIKIQRGGGAFICGESTALMASLEGKVGEPRAKYIHTSEQGLWNRPTNLNNVETWANVPLIITNGSAWYSQIGTKGSKGTKIFSLVGNISNTGLVEVPMGTPLREIVFDIGGGIPKGRKFKAVQTGGPSGGVIPESMLDIPVDFDELTKVGSMMGSGGMIVMDDKTCMVDMARYYTAFLEGESCGKCVPCREGLRQMCQILTGITEGRGKMEDIALLEEICATLVDAALCQLGASAPNPVMSTIRHFRAEYEAHIKEHRCPAGVCKIGAAAVK